MLPALIPVLVLACSTLTPATPTAGIDLPPLEPTVVLPTAIPQPTTPPLPTVIPGWLTYHNTMFGYSFDYPPDAEFISTGVSGYPTDELPAGIGPGEYIATLEATYTEPLCAGVGLPTASFVLQVSQERGGRYAGPCGVTGIGVYDIRKGELPVRIDGEDLTLGLTRVYEVGTDTLVNEFGHVTLSDGTRMTIMSHWQDLGLTYQDYLAEREVLLQVLASFRRDR
jgi:hypothetical protein